MIPVLETERLTLRGWKPADFDPLASFMADADVMKYLSGHPMSRGDALPAACPFHHRLFSRPAPASAGGPPPPLRR